MDLIYGFELFKFMTKITALIFFLRLLTIHAIVNCTIRICRVTFVTTLAFGGI